MGDEVVRRYPSSAAPGWEVDRINRAVLANIHGESLSRGLQYHDSGADEFFAHCARYGIPDEAGVFGDAVWGSLKELVVGMDVHVTPDGLLVDAYTRRQSSDQEIEKLAQYVAGQLSDGWGESFVQRTVYEYMVPIGCIEYCVSVGIEFDFGRVAPKA